MTKLYLTSLSEQDKEAFIAGWKSAGGYMDDADSPCPWCAPWASCDSIDVEGETLEEMGADYWRQCKPEIEAQLAEEKALVE